MSLLWFGRAEFLESINWCLSPNLGSFYHDFTVLFFFFFLLQTLIPLFWPFSDVYVRISIIYSHSFLKLFGFFKILCFKSDHFYCPIFKVTGYFLCHLYTANDTIQWLFFICYIIYYNSCYIFECKIFHVALFWYFLLLYWKLLSFYSSVFSLPYKA